MTSPNLPIQSEEHIGDLAMRAADELRQAHEAEIAKGGDEFVDQAGEIHRENRRSIFTKIEFSWRPSDARVLDYIRSGGDLVFRKMFAELIQIVDEFYARAKIPEVDQNGEVVIGQNGRVVFRQDAQGREIEDWHRLTAADIETTLLKLLQLKLVLTPMLDELLLEAVFARHIAEDMSAEGYAELLDGTIGDRNAHASRVARADKYNAFFRYYLYKQADSFMREIANFTRVCERIRYWREGGSKTP